MQNQYSGIPYYINQLPDSDPFKIEFLRIGGIPILVNDSTERLALTASIGDNAIQLSPPAIYVYSALDTWTLVAQPADGTGSAGIDFATVAESRSGSLSTKAVSPNSLLIRKIGTSIFLGDHTSSLRGLDSLDLQVISGSTLGNYSTAIGNENTVGTDSISGSAIGVGNYVSSSLQGSAIGYRNIASGSWTTSVGFKNTAQGNGSSAFGYLSTTREVNATSVGCQNLSSGFRSAAVGYLNTGSNQLSTAVGAMNISTNIKSNAFGNLNTATGLGSSAFGYRNTSAGKYSSAFGYFNTTSGNYGSAFGYKNTASGSFSTTVGQRVKTLVNNSQEFGYWSSTSARGASVRINGVGDVALTVRKTDTAKTDGGATAGSEADGTLMRSAISFRVSTTDGLIAEYNDGGVIKTLSIGTLT